MQYHLPYLPLSKVIRTQNLSLIWQLTISLRVLWTMIYQVNQNPINTPKRLRVRSLQGNLRPGAMTYWPRWSRAGLRFPCNDRMNEVNKLFIIWPVFLVLLLKWIRKTHQKKFSTTGHERSFEVIFTSKNEPGDAIKTIHKTLFLWQWKNGPEPMIN